MDTSKSESFTRRNFLRAGAGAATVATVTASTASGQEGAYGNHLSDTGNFNGMTADATGRDEAVVRVGAAGNASNKAFSPAAILVEPGTKITWEWTGKGGPHNVAHRPDPDPNRGSEAFNSQGVAHDGVATPEAGTTFERTFEEAGSFYPYVCTPHQVQGMKGIVVVGADNVQTDLEEYGFGSGRLNTTPIWGGAFAFGLVSFLGVAAYRSLVDNE